MLSRVAEVIVGRVNKNDMSDWLVHLTKMNEPEGIETESEARARSNKPFFNLLKILADRHLLGSHGYIIDNIDCVCFTESTLETLKEIFDNRHKGFRYQPFGIMVPKRIVFEKGGLPVIYQPRSDLDLLDRSKRHLHVTFDLPANLDFTWEREWRLRTNRLVLDPAVVRVLVPAAGLRNFVGRWLDIKAQPNDDPWQYVILNEIGVNVTVDEAALTAAD